MPIPSYKTPAAKVFGMGIDPLHRYFRPPEGMENDPAYREDVRQQMEMVADEDRFKQEQARADATFAAESEAIEWAKNNPDLIPNIFAANPQLALSPNAKGFAQVAAAPSKAQDTLAPSLRMKLPASARARFDEAYSKFGNAVQAFDEAEIGHAQDEDYADMMGKGVPFTEVDRLRQTGRRLSPVEKAALVQQHSTKGPKNPMQEAYELDLKGMFGSGELAELKPQERVQRIRDLRLAYGLDKDASPPPAIPNVAASPTATVSPKVEPSVAQRIATGASSADLRKQKEDAAWESQREQRRKGIEDEWVKAENTLREPLLQQLPQDETERLAALADIWRNQYIPNIQNGVDVGGSLPPSYYLPKIGMSSTDVLFSDPERSGPDDITAKEVLQALARKLFFEETGIDLANASQSTIQQAAENTTSSGNTFKPVQ